MGKKKKEKKKTANEFLDDDGMKGDFTSFVVCALTEDGLLFILDVVNARMKLEDNAPGLARLCRKWKPLIVAGDDDMLSSTMLLDCRRYRDIPEIRCLPISGRDKLTRAQAAIIHGENERILLPEETRTHKYPWLEPFMDQLSSFTGIDDEHDDMVDSLGILGRLADELKGDGRQMPMPDVLMPVTDRFAPW
jgi:predicted phage terminase large subunit-like protein